MPIPAVEFIGGWSAWLRDAVDHTPELSDPSLLDAIRAFRVTTADG